MPKIGFIADMNISPKTVNILRHKGWDVVRVSEVLDCRSDDSEILEYAKKHHKTIITLDLDFSMLLAIGDFKKPSVINLRIQNPDPVVVSQRIIESVTEMEKEIE